MTWITGEKILERAGWSEFALKRAYRSGLSPYRIFDDARMVSGSKCCFNCTKANPNYTPGFLDERGNCIPIKLPDMPEGLTATCQPLDLALEIDPVLVNHFFEAGAFVFHSGVFGHGITPSVARLLTGILGPNAVERLMLEGMCADFDPMGHLDMGDRLKAATFKLSDVEAYEGREGIGQDGAGQVKELEAPESMQPEAEHEPTNAAEYAAWRKATIRSIHNGELMLEIQERWGKPPHKTMVRAEMAALVREPGNPPPNKKTDLGRWLGLEKAFKNDVDAYKRQLRQKPIK